MKLYLVGKFIDIGPAGRAAWELVGVFRSQDEAEGQCVEATYFVNQMELDAAYPADMDKLPSMYYPKVEGRPTA